MNVVKELLLTIHIKRYNIMTRPYLIAEGNWSRLALSQI